MCDSLAVGTSVEVLKRTSVRTQQEARAIRQQVGSAHNDRLHHNSVGLCSLRMTHSPGWTISRTVVKPVLFGCGKRAVSLVCVACIRPR